MFYLYHRVPKDMQGSVLYPLNQLKALHPEQYTSAAAKYVGREKLMQFEIPQLRCLWNDVIHLSPVHPSDIKNALGSAFRPRGFRFYVIDPVILNPEKTIVYLSDEGKSGIKNFVQFNVESLPEYSKFPERTQRHYDDFIAKGKQPLLFDGIPHILYKGSIEVTDLKIV